MSSKTSSHRSSACETSFCRDSWHGDAMPVDITVYDIPESIRDRLAENAADRSQSLEEYLRAELERLAAKPSVESWLAETRSRVEAAGNRVSASEILDARDADRR